MKYLIIHPKDPTTQFLSPIYDPLKNKSVITGGITQNDLRKLIKSHDRIIMMGHGNGSGLMSVGQFPDDGYSIIDDSMVDDLREKENSIYIWCDAGFSLLFHHLPGLNRGVLIPGAMAKTYTQAHPEPFPPSMGKILLKVKERSISSPDPN